MDTSETYIKMCEKAEEIQALAPSRYGWSEETIPSLFRNHIWLPRQDQLQEMIGDTPYYNFRNSIFSVLDDFRNYIFATNFKEYIPLTMEQLWLSFVMKEKYGKIWNGEDWTNVTARKDS